jgi:hypothetical protein
MRGAPRWQLPWFARRPPSPLRPWRTRSAPGSSARASSSYADYTASGRSLDFIEDAIREQVPPLYADTGTERSGTGLATRRRPARCALVVTLAGLRRDVGPWGPGGKAGTLSSWRGEW